MDMDPNENNENQINRRKKRGRNKSKDPKSDDTEGIEFNKFGQCVKKYQNQFASQCGVYTRTRISINHSSWNKVPKSQKEALWLLIKKHFKLENDHARKRTLKACNSIWKKFKTTLRADFMDVDKSPCEEFTFITEAAWQEFLRREDTPEKQRKRLQGRLNGQTQNNRPRLGRIGYRGHQEKWKKEKESEELKTEYHDIEDERAKNFVLARTRLDEHGRRTLMPDMIDVANKLIECDQNISHGLVDYGEDPIINVLGPEHPGRTRGVGSDIGWRMWVEGHAQEKNMSKIDKEEMERVIDDRLKRALEEQRVKHEAHNLEMQKQHQEELKNMRDEYMQTIVSLKKNLEELTKGQSNPLLIPQNNMQTRREPIKPRLQDIKEPLQVALFDPESEDFVPVARGKVHPTIKAGTLHGSPILPWYMKVSIDHVFDKYMDLKLPVPVREEIIRLGQAVGSFIQWRVPRMRMIKTTVTEPNKKLPPPLPESDFFRMLKEKEERRKQEEEDKRKKEEEKKKRGRSKEEKVGGRRTRKKVEYVRSIDKVARVFDSSGSGYIQWLHKLDASR